MNERTNKRMKTRVCLYTLQHQQEIYTGGSSMLSLQLGVFFILPGVCKTQLIFSDQPQIHRFFSIYVK